MRNSTEVFICDNCNFESEYEMKFKQCPKCRNWLCFKCYDNNKCEYCITQKKEKIKLKKDAEKVYGIGDFIKKERK